MQEKKYRIHPLRVVLFLMIAVLILISAYFLIMQFRLHALNQLMEEGQAQIDAYRYTQDNMSADASTQLDQEDLENYLREHGYGYPGENYYR